MANSGVGNKFASVNLNKSYGSALHSNQSNNGGYGLGRGRGGGGGGMVVLSRPRSAHKVGPKLSVPPPLNLPSLRKEHEKFDTLGSGSGAGGGGGSGARPSSSGIGWSKPSVSVVVDRDEKDVGDKTLSREGVQASVTTSSAYMPPSVRAAMGAGGDVSMVPSAEKVSVLRGEDFPSLRATLTSENGQSQKQKDLAHQKNRSDVSVGPSGGPNVQSSVRSVDNVKGGNDKDHEGKYRPQEQVRKQDDYFLGPLPLVRLSPRSDWADDERDTSHGLSNTRDHGYSRTEAYWDMDFDFPRNSFLPNKPAQYQFDRRGLRDDDVGKGLSNEVPSLDPFTKYGRAPSSEGRQEHPWRTNVAKDGFGSHDVNNNRNNLGANPVNVNLEMNKESKYTPPQFGGTTRDERINGGYTANNLGPGRRDQGYKHSGKQPWTNSVDTNNGRGADRNFQQGFVSDSNRYRVDPVRNNMGARPSFSTSGKGSSDGYHVTNFSRDKRSFSKSEKPYVEDPFMGSNSFDGQDPFSGGILGVVKRKKDSNVMLDFHDPVRESFEAELERVQQIQEQERLRVVEEQERAMEMARREEEERVRVIREQEERQRRLNEEAREAAWREEQEKVEAMRKAEELKIAREEERQRMMMEEERRKQAAKQKLLELEEKIARRQAESSKADSSSATSGDIMAGTVKERDLSKPDDFASWEDGERMVERITNSASSDSSLSRPFDLRPRAVSDRDGSFAFTDKGKPFNSWRRDIFDSGNNSSFFSVDHENGHLSPRREAAIGGRSFPRKDFYSGQGYMPSSGHYRAGVPEPHMDDFPHTRGHNRWNISREGDPFGRNMEFEEAFHENVADKFDMGWGQGHVHGRGRGYSHFPDRLYENSDLDEFYSYGRSRLPARQPRVLPPPALSSVHQASFRNESDCLGSSSFGDGNAHFNHALQDDSTAGNYQNAHEESSNIIDVQEQRLSPNEDQEQDKRNALGCDSQSSLSVSSPPSSPTQLSHDDFDESRDSLPVKRLSEGQDISFSENEADLPERKDYTVATASSVSVDDDEGWNVENIEVSHDQEDCNEDVGYLVENEVHEAEGDNSELTRDFEEMQLKEKASSDTTDNLVLGFDQGVEVRIPNDDQEETSRVDEVGVMEQNESFDAEEAQNDLQSHVSKPNNASVYNPMSLDPSTEDSSSNSVMNSDSQPSNQAVPSVLGPQGPVELPKLQFGLFSGPSLIPSPVPSIQIGSIQMPLHIAPPLPHMHTSQPPLFQFGKLGYPSPMSSGILSLPPQPMSCVQPNVPSNFPPIQVPKGPITGQDSSSRGSAKNNGSTLKESNVVAGVSTETKVLSRENQVEASGSSVDAGKPELGRRTNNFMRNAKPMLNNRVPESRPQGRGSSFRSASNIRNAGGPATNQFPARNGRRFGHSSRNPDNEFIGSDGNGFPRRSRRVTQRYEFRVRQTAEGKQSSLEGQSNYDAKDSGTQPDSGLNKEVQLDRPKQVSNWSSDKYLTQDTTSVLEENNPAAKHASINVGHTSLHPEGSLNRDINSEADVDVPLQSGVVRVYQQPGIEAPSDEDDFIEVRSKRQMLNDRREQREKEIKAKSSSMRKAQRKSRSTPQGLSPARISNRTSDLLNAQAARSTHPAVTSKRGILNNQVSDGQTNANSLTLKPVQTGSYSTAERTVCGGSSDLTSGGSRKVDSVQSTTVGSWAGSCTSQSVMTLTQSQLEEAMKPACFDANIVSIGDQSSSVSDPVMPLSSVSKASPVNSLLAGEKIQFGAVTSPTTLSASPHVVSQSVRPSALSSLDVHTSQRKSEIENNSDKFLGKEKRLNESSRPLEVSDAEAAASAIAVVAIGNDEVAENGVVGVAINGISTGISGDHHTASQSKAEETLTVSLPADLSVETPPISIWPPLPSPHSSSTQMLSAFPGGPTSHYPFYDMNPMMGGPVFAFGHRDESNGAPSQPQKSTTPSSGPLGTWQQCHTGVDSLYGPSGFRAPFINPPPGSVPGVQGPPHMVVYNHFASVGQFGQVGLSYMGTTYVPSGKQPDWKHNPSSTPMGGTEGEINNVNMVPVLRNASNVPPQVHHLAPGSPLLSMASPLAMYEVSPFQPSPDLSIHPHWPHAQASSVHTIPQSMPLQNQSEVTLPSQFSHDHPSSITNGFSKSQNSSPLDVSFSVGHNTGTTQFTAEHRSEGSTLNLGTKGPFGDSTRNENNSRGYVSRKNTPAHQKNSSGQQSYSQYQRGAGQKNGLGTDWSNRKMGFRGRNQSSGGERTFPPTTKVKQIYVAKQNITGTSSDV